MAGQIVTSAPTKAMRSAVGGLVIFGTVLYLAAATAPRSNRLKDPYPTFNSDGRLTDEQRLLATLMVDYDRHTRPVMNASHKVQVKLGITLNQIFDVEWHDEKLIWSPEDFNGLRTLRVPCHLIWKPDIVLYNSADEYNQGYMPALAMVSSDGHVFWPPIVKLRSTCQIDITYFPFDDQMCFLKLGSWAYDGFQVDVLKRDKPIDLTNYVSNGEWELLNVQVVRNVQVYSCCPEPYPDVTFALHMRRRTLYYTYNVIIPCIMLSCLTVLGFWMPPEGGEKVALGLTVLLAYSVFMLLIAENMPATSYYVPLIGVYIIVDMGLSSLSVMFAVSVSYMHHQSFMGREVPGYLRKMASIFNRWLMIQPRGKRRGDCKAPSTTETTPDLKTPLRDSLSSINCSFTQDVDNGDTFLCNSEVVANTRALAHGGAATTHAHSRSVDAGLSKEAKQASSSGRTRKKSERKMYNDELMKRLDLLFLRQEELLKSKQSETNREWQEVAEVIDRTLFWVYVVVTFMTTVVILVLVPLGKTVHM